jgi:hypothetical protein
VKMDEQELAVGKAAGAGGVGAITCDGGGGGHHL